MIKCGKCGRRYDYDKYNGICPSCGRYNRSDSAVLESELHSKYDQDPAHTVKAHERVHEKNYDSTRHGFDSQKKSENDYWNTDKSPKKHRFLGVIIGILIVLIFFVVGALGGFGAFVDDNGFASGFISGLEDSNAGLFSDILESLDGYSADNLFDDSDKEIPAVEGGISLTSAYMEEVGQTLTDVDWENDYSIDASYDELSQMEALEEDYYDRDGMFYVVTMLFANDLQEDFSATTISDADIVFSDLGESGWSDVGLLIFYTYWETIEAGEEGYLDCLIYIPDEVTELAGEEDYIELNIEYTTIQDGETYVNTYESVYYYPEY